MVGDAAKGRERLCQRAVDAGTGQGFVVDAGDPGRLARLGHCPLVRPAADIARGGIGKAHQSAGVAGGRGGEDEPAEQWIEANPRGGPRGQLPRGKIGERHFGGRDRVERAISPFDRDFQRAIEQVFVGRQRQRKRGVERGVERAVDSPVDPGRGEQAAIGPHRMEAIAAPARRFRRGIAQLVSGFVPKTGRGPAASRRKLDWPTAERGKLVLERRAGALAPGKGDGVGDQRPAVGGVLGRSVATRQPGHVRQRPILAGLDEPAAKERGNILLDQRARAFEHFEKRLEREPCLAIATPVELRKEIVERGAVRHRTPSGGCRFHRR